MKKYLRHLQIIIAALVVIVGVGGVSIWTAKGEAKYKMSIGQHRIRFLPVNKWGFSSSSMDYCGPTSGTWQTRVFGPVEIGTNL